MRRVSALLAMIALLGLHGVASAQTDPSSDAPTVETDKGAVVGTVVDGVQKFLGIPYAAPPLGDLRWKAPQPHPGWDEPLQTTDYGSGCPQILPVVNVFVGNEDCLFLNVVTPDPAPDEPAPVMVWLHGGGFTVGQADHNDPSKLVAKTDVVVVTINYRLGPLGYLAHPALTKEDPRGTAGNAATEDQTAALRWVQRNIEAFGGDPDNVTLFGESAGGISVCLQMLSPSARGLFHRAVNESGPCTRMQPKAQAEAQGERFAEALGCANAKDALACMRATSPEEAINALPPDPTFLFNRTANWLPTQDGVVLPRNLERAMRTGRFNRVPLIAGANRDEGRLFIGIALNAQGESVTAEEWSGAIDDYFGAEFGDEIRGEYPLEEYPDPGAAFGQAIGDAVLTCPAIDGARLMARHVPVYLYEFDHEPNPFVLPMPGIELGAFHGAEMPYVFAGPVAASGGINFTPDEQRLVDVVTGGWTSFARTGTPDVGNLDWVRLSPRGTAKYLALDAPDSAVRSGMKARECAFWADLGWQIEAS